MHSDLPIFCYGFGKDLYYFRDKQGLEVDFVLDEGNRRLTLIEAKATQTPMPNDARSLVRLGKAIDGYTVSQWVVHTATHSPATMPLMPGVTAVCIRHLHEVL